LIINILISVAYSLLRLLHKDTFSFDYIIFAPDVVDR